MPRLDAKIKEGFPLSDPDAPKNPDKARNERPRGRPQGRSTGQAGKRPSAPHGQGARKGSSARRSGRGGQRAASSDDDSGWVWGGHAARAALANPSREVFEILATRNAARELGETRIEPRIVEPRAIDQHLPAGASHQGLAVRCTQPETIPLADLAAVESGVVMVLDQVTDPRNVGAVLRSAAAFGALGVVLQDRKAPPFLGACAKAAVGAADALPHARVVNISRALNQLSEAGWRCVGLAGEGVEDLPQAVSAPKIALVMGSEDKGLRPSVAEACDQLSRIPISGEVESLNISVAAAVALYEASRAQTAFNLG